jgi:PKHD-type hydroxylase
MYNKIYNNPIERARIIYPYCYRDGVFTDQELDNMCQYFSQHEVEKATVMSKERPLDENIRRSRVNFFNRDEYTFPIFDRLNNTIEEINDRFYNFTLNGYDSFQYTEYHHDENGEYNFHMDTGFGDRFGDDHFETRKLSVVMCLNRPGIDFEGGQFYMNQGSEKDAFEVEMKRGRIIFFPSFLIHRVAPVTKGVRKSLVIWVTGPKFR